MHRMAALMIWFRVAALFLACQPMTPVSGARFTVFSFLFAMQILGQFFSRGVPGLSWGRNARGLSCAILPQRGVKKSLLFETSKHAFNESLRANPAGAGQSKAVACPMPHRRATIGRS
jgi:hypothetical protein